MKERLNIFENGSDIFKRDSCKITVGVADLLEDTIGEFHIADFLQIGGCGENKVD